MKNLSTEFKRALALNKRNYIANATITWPIDTNNNSQVLNLTNAEIWGGGFSYEELVSEDDEFTALGSVYMGTASLLINNMNEQYNSYVFEEAETVVLTLGLELPNSNNQSGTRTETLKIGTYHVSDATYDGTRVSLKLQDNIAKLDKPYRSSNLVYPATLNQIVNDMCTNCGLVLANNSLQFPQRTLLIQNRPDDEAITFRDVLGWVATIAGCFVKCNPDGQLEFKWFDQSVIEQELTIIDGGTVTPWSTGENYNGGTVSPWSTGTTIDSGVGERQYSFHRLSSLFSQNIALDDVVITGISIQVNDDTTIESSSGEESESEESESEESESDVETEISDVYFRGSNGYLISISDNKFITHDNVESIIDFLALQLIGFRFRKMTISIPNDPSIEAGDIMLVFDRKGREYVGLVTRTSFSIGGTQEIVSGASTPTRNSATTYSEYTRSIVEARKLLAKQKSAFDLAMEDLSDRLNSKSGLYPTIEQTQSGNIYYLHDQPLLEDSTTVLKITNEAIGITNNYDGEDTAWNFGIAVNGTVIAQILNTIGINAQWIRTGVLSIHNSNDREIFNFDAEHGTLNIYDNDGNVIFSVDVTNRALTIIPTTFTLTSANLTTINNEITSKGYQTASQVSDAVSAGWTALTQSDVMTKLTNNGANQGIYLSNGNIYINASAINSGTISADRIGANSITAGKISVSDLSAFNATIGGFAINDTTLSSRYDYVANGTYHDFIIHKMYNSQTKALQVVVTNKSTLETTDYFYVNYAGKMYAKNAEIEGSIVATSLTLGNNVSISSGKVSGLAAVATSGSYSDLSGKPTIPDVSIYIAKDGTIGQEPGSGRTGFKVSSAGLLTCSNAIVYGTVYSSGGLIGGWTIDTDEISCGNIHFQKSNLNVSGNPSTITLGSKNSSTYYINGNGWAKFSNVESNYGDFSTGLNCSGAFWVGSGSMTYLAASSTGVRIPIFNATYLGTDNTGKIINSGSSIRFKIVSKIPVDVSGFYKLNAVMAKYKPGILSKGSEFEDKDMPMLIAEEVEEVCEEAVVHDNEGHTKDWNFRVMIPVHQQMLVEQHRIIEQQEEKIKSLEQRLAKLEKLVEDILK